MSPAETQRLLALVRGEPVGEACPKVHPVGLSHSTRCDCHGTGRINAEPANEVERAVAALRDSFETIRAMEESDIRERDEALQALEAERAAHITWELEYTEEHKAHEETKRQLEVTEGLVEALKIAKRLVREERDTALRDLVHVKEANDKLFDQRDQALREKAEAEAELEGMRGMAGRAVEVGQEIDEDRVKALDIADKVLDGIEAAEQRAAEAEAARDAALARVEGEWVTEDGEMKFLRLMDYKQRAVAYRTSGVEEMKLRLAAEAHIETLREALRQVRMDLGVRFQRGETNVRDAYKFCTDALVATTPTSPISEAPWLKS